MRSTLFAFVVLFASTTQAAYTFVPYIAHNNATFVVPIDDPNELGPLDFTFEWQWDDWTMTYTLNDLMPSDEGTVWEIENDIFGIDFDRVAEYSLDHWPDRLFRDRGDNIEWLLPRPTSIIDTPLGTYGMSECCMMTFQDTAPDARMVLDRIRVYIERFQYRGREDQVYVTVHTFLIGGHEPVATPEPATIMLLALGCLMFLGLWRR